MCFVPINVCCCSKGASNPPPETPRAEKSKHAKVMEYTLNSALKHGEITQSQMETILGLFEEAEVGITHLMYVVVTSSVGSNYC